MATVEDLERRVVALEKAQNENTVTLKWVVGTLGQVKAVVDHHTEVLAGHTEVLASHSATLADHTKRLGRIETRLDKVETRLDKIDARLDNLETGVKDLPRVITEQMIALLDARDARRKL